MSWTSKSVGRMQRQQRLRAAQAALRKAQSRLRKGARRWPFEGSEWATVSNEITAAAVRKLGPAKYAEIEAAIAHDRQSGALDKVRTLSDLSKLSEATMQRLAKREAEGTAPDDVSEDESARAQVRAAESLAAGLIGALRKGGKR